MRNIRLAFAAIMLAFACAKPETATRTAAPAVLHTPEVQIYETSFEFPRTDTAVTSTAQITNLVPGYIIKDERRWKAGSTLRVCFMDGTAISRKMVADAASIWQNFGNIRLDFGAGPNFYQCGVSDVGPIRISFRGRGYNSAVGDESLFVPAGQATMNLQDLDTRPPAKASARATIIHEFGHALAFEHEHQNPSGGCDSEFDWPKVYAELAKPPNGWSPAQVDFNLRSLPDSTAYPRSNHDAHSIMHYSFDPWMFKRGAASPCYTARNYDLSPLDIEGARTFYPSDAAADTKQREETLEKLLVSVGKNSPAASAYLKRSLRQIE